MRSLARTPFIAVFQNEVLLNSKRVAPYVMAILFGSNALLWWGWGPATGRGLATNSDSFIAGMLPVYSFMTLPLFTALMMADPVIRDFRLRVDPLIFSKPVSQAEYLLGKFFGNFFVLVCCQAAFVLTLFVLQAFRRPGMIVQEVRVFPYLKHFLVFVVISHLVLAAFYFTVGTLTRNAKIVYGLGVSFYPLYIAYQVVVLRTLPPRWRSVLDPLLMNWGDKFSKGRSAEWVNQLIVAYDSDLIVNRALMIVIAAVCMAILYVRFTRAEETGYVEHFSTLKLSTAGEGAYYDSESLLATRGDRTETPESSDKESIRIIPLPEVVRANEGIGANVSKLIAALCIEFRLLCAERSLVVFMPLAIFLSTLEVAFYDVVPVVSYSATYATNTAQSILLFLLALTIFYTGEVMHRDREIRIEPVLWAAPASNNVLLLSKFLVMLLLTLFLVGLVGITAIAIQILRGHTPVEISPYLITYSLILLPGIVVVTGVSIALNVLLRNKYLAFVVSIGTGAGLFYLYGQGHNHWLYNPLLYQLWKYVDLTGAGHNQAIILLHRVYCLATAGACLSLAHLFFQRKTAKGIRVDSRLSGTGWSILLTVLALVIAVVAGLRILSLTG